MARVPEDQSFNPLPTKNTLKVVKLNYSKPIHLYIIILTFCNPGYVKGYLRTAFMARGHDDHSFNSLPTRNILKVFDSTHSWLEHLHVIHLTICQPELVKDYFINPSMARAH